MKSIAFIDTEINADTKKILDIGSIRDNDAIFHSASINDFTKFLTGVEFICGHNIINHDIRYIRVAVTGARIESFNIIDTLYLSPLLFPTKPYHADNTINLCRPLTLS